MPLIEFTDCGLYCRPADVFIDPWKPVDKAIITHAHSDHARWGMKQYLAHRLSVPIMKLRLGDDINVTGMEYGESVNMNGVKISLHPAGHIIGSAQVRVEYKGEIWVISGDYKLTDDGISTPFEPVKCHHFITESTFGLPVFRFRPQVEEFTAINGWWMENKAKGQATVLVAYALGKAQRLLQNVDATIGPIWLHGAIHNTNRAFIDSGMVLPPAQRILSDTPKSEFPGSLIIATPSSVGSPWLRRFYPYSIGIASGWMALRGTRRRRNVDRGFAISDHCDWDQLNTAIKETGAENIYVTHGYTTIFAEWLRQNGYNATVVQTKFEGEQIENTDESPGEDTGGDV